MNYKEILNKLPGSWDELKLRDYIKLAPVISDNEEDVLHDPNILTIRYLNELDKNIEIISLLTDTPAGDIELLTMVQLDELVNRLAFIQNVPDKPKTTIKYKRFEELTYDNFITFQKLQISFTPEAVLTNAIGNLPTMLSVFTKEGLTEEQILNLSMVEVIAGFFTVTQNIERYLKRLQRSSLLSLMKVQKNQIKHLVTLYWKKAFQSKKSLTKTGIIG